MLGNKRSRNYSLPGNATVEDYEEQEKFLNSIPTISYEDLTKTLMGKRHQMGKKGVSSSGDKFDSFWEFTFWMHAKYVSHMPIIRNKTEWLTYYDDHGDARKFYPDFFFNGQYCEIKGILRRNDELKQQQHPEVRFVYGDEINQMKKDLFQERPGWDKEFIPSHTYY